MKNINYINRTFLILCFSFSCFSGAFCRFVTNGDAINVGNNCFQLTTTSTFLSGNGTLNGSQTICAGETVALTFSLTGTAPFNIIYSENDFENSLFGISDGHTIEVTPTQTTSYTLLGVTDSSPSACSNDLNSNVVITLSDGIEVVSEATICQGERLFLGGDFQEEAGTYGCDSLIIWTITEE